MSKARDLSRGLLDQLNVDSNTLAVDVANNRVGVGKTDPATALDVLGTITADGLTVDGPTVLQGNLNGPATFIIDPAAHGDDTGTVIIAGNLQVDGLTTTINSTTLTVDDKNIVLASGAPNASAADGAGITVDGASATLLYASSGDKFVLNKPLDVTGAGTFSNSINMTAGNLSLNSTSDGNQAFRYFRADGTIVVQQYPYNNRFNVQSYNNQGIRIKSHGSGQIELEGNVVINEDSASLDFRVESDTNPYMLFVDGSANTVLIGGNVNYENGTLQVQGVKTLVAGIPQKGIAITDTTPMAQGVGGGITFNGEYQTGGNYTNFASIEGYKTLSNNGNYDGTLVLKARAHGAAAIEKLRLSSTEAVFNDEGLDTDFRVASDTNAHALFVQGSDGKVGIGVGSPSSALDIRGSGNVDIMSKIINTGQTSDGRKTEFLFGKDNGANLSGVLKYVYDTTQANRRIDLVHYGTSNGISILDGGNVGIGTSSPSAVLHLKNTIGSALTLLKFETGWDNPSGSKSIEWADATNTLGRISVDYTAPQAKMRFGSLYNSGYQTGDLMTLTADGNVGIGTSSPFYKIDGGFVNQTWGWYLNTSYNSGFTYNTTERSLLIHTKSSENIDHIKFATGGAATERMRIDSVGNLQLGYGGQSPTAFAAPQGIAIHSLDNIDLQYYLRKGNQVEAHIGFGGGTNTNFYVGTGGGAGPGGIGSYGLYQANLSTTWTGTSDERLKTDLEPIENALDKVRGVRSYTGRFIHDEANGVTRRLPFLIAQDFVTALPEAVDNQDPDKLGLSYSDTVVLLFAAVNELIKENDTLKDRITALEA